MTMPVQKDLKRLVRARMQKTGESYTAARATLLRKAAPDTSAHPKVDYATLAGFSDKTIKEKTGCTWERWVPMLDGLGAASMSHGEIARLVHDKFKVDGWWARAVTVGYERIKGRRAIGQRLDGKYEASKSKTFHVPVAELFDAWATARQRKRWLDTSVTVRTATKPKSMRLGWNDRTIVAVWFTPKGTGKSVVALAHTKLPDKATSERLKQYWAERLTALQQVLAG
jgi:uncharacterized protein YndB with AHSA1/START domain